VTGLLSTRNLWLASLFALTVAGCAAMETAKIQPPGIAAPDFTLVSLSNRAVTLADFKGKRNVVLVFYFGHD